MSQAKILTYDASEIARIINLAKDSVEKSCFGPIFVIPDPNDISNKQMNALSWQVFGGLLPVMLKAYFDDVADCDSSG